MEIKVERTVDNEVLAKLNESIQSLHQQLYPEEFKTFDFESAKKAFTKLLSVPGTYAFVAKNDTQPIGYVLCFVKKRAESEFQFAKTVLHIDQISVEPKYRNQGVAQQLLTQAVQLADELNIVEIQLDHWESKYCRQ